MKKNRLFIILLIVGGVVYCFGYWLVEKYFTQYNVDKIMNYFGIILTFIVVFIGVLSSQKNIKKK